MAMSTKKASGRKTTAKTKAASKSSAKAAKKPAKKVPRGAKARWKLFREKLDRAFGPIFLPETETVLEKAAALVLREQGTELTTTKALESLRADFVDWNEVRLSRPSELARLMTGTSKVATLKRWHERAERLGEMIDQVYNDKNDPSWEFLLELKTKARFEYLEDVDDLGLHNAYALVQWLSGDDKKLVLVSSEMAQASQALGLTESAAVTKVKKELSDLAGDFEELVTLQAHLNQLGDMEKDEWPGALKELLD